MKKLLVITLVVCILIIPSFAFAIALEDPDSVDEGVVGDGIVTDEPYLKIASEEPVVGDDIEIGEDEAKIVSVDGESDVVVGDDIEIGDGEFKIISYTGENAKEDKANKALPYMIGGGIGVLGIAGFTLRKKFAHR